MYHLKRTLIDEITAFIFMENPLEKADVIFIPGDARPEHTEEAARLYARGYAPLLVPSGRFAKVQGRFQGVKAGADVYGDSFSCEADFLEKVLLDNGVPKEAILKEDQATYTLENAEKSRALLIEHGHVPGVDLKKAIVCCKAHHARRCCLYYGMVFPELDLIIHPVAVDGIDRRSWYGTEAGRELVLGEHARIGQQLLMMEGRICWD